MELFDKKIKREHTNSVKWDRRLDVFGEADVIPLWVADMDFASPKEVIQAMQRRLDHQIFGYTDIPEALYDATIAWNLRRHQLIIHKEQIIFSSSVLSSLNMFLRLLTKERDRVLMLTPVYFPFFTIVKALKRVPVYSKMKVVNNEYKLDLLDFEQQIIEHQPKVLLFCNPHNPGGRVWTKKELMQVVELCEKYQIEIISDDIHKDIVFPKITYTPMLNVTTTYKEHIFITTAPTKVFNIAGLKIAYNIISNENIKKRFHLETKKLNFSSLNIFAIEAMLAAYTQCDDWVDALNAYLAKGYQLLQDGLAQTKFSCLKNEGTFLLWIDYQAYGVASKEMEKKLIEAKLGIQMGEQFGDAGYGYFRLNIGTQHEVLKTVVEKLQDLDRALQ